jgi:hypothetical protein
MIPRSLFAELLGNGIERIRQKRELDPKPVVKIFDPSGSATWLLTEVDPADPDRAFGLCDLGLGCPELGYVSIRELASTRNRLGLLLEIDNHFRPTKTLSEYADEARRRGRIVT